jgi:antitoxin HigA-1
LVHYRRAYVQIIARLRGTHVAPDTDGKTPGLPGIQIGRVSLNKQRAQHKAYPMTEFPIRDPKRCPTHPGAVLADIVFPATDLSKTEIAKRLGISRQTLHDLLAAKQPVTPQMAVRIGKFLGNNPAVWLDMQIAHDLWHACRTTDVSNIPTFKPAKKPSARGGSAHR